MALADHIPYPVNPSRRGAWPCTCRLRSSRWGPRFRSRSACNPYAATPVRIPVASPCHVLAGLYGRPPRLHGGLPVFSGTPKRVASRLTIWRADGGYLLGYLVAQSLTAGCDGRRLDGACWRCWPGLAVALCGVLRGCRCSCLPPKLLTAVLTPFCWVDLIKSCWQRH